MSRPSALQPHQSTIKGLGEHFGNFCFTDTGLAFKEERCRIFSARYSVVDKARSAT